MGEQVNKNVPAIRFKGFSGEWQQQEIGNVVEEKKRPIILNDNQRYELITVKRRNGGVVSRGYLLGKEILVKNYYQLQENDFVISKRQVVHGATGIISKELDKAIVSNEYLVAVSNDRLTTEFLNLLSCQPKLKKDFFLSSYGVDIEKLFFDADDWKKRSISIPTKTEQQKVGNFFKQLDTNLKLYQTKLDKLSTLKQAMLQKMFPQGDATEPEIRFKGFSGEWVKVAVKEIGTVVTGNTPQKSNAKNYDGHILWATAEDFKHKYISETNLKLTDEGAKNIHIVPEGSVLVTCIASIGKNAIANKKLATNQQINSVIINQNYNNEFFFYSISLNVNELLLLAGVTAVPIVNKSNFENILISVPSLEEQKKIGAYFRKLDELIALEHTQLDKLKQIKQACLAGMFV